MYNDTKVLVNHNVVYCLVSVVQNWKLLFDNIRAWRNLTLGLFIFYHINSVFLRLRHWLACNQAKLKVMKVICTTCYLWSNDVKLSTLHYGTLEK